jgi:hypothetical protein
MVLRIIVVFVFRYSLVVIVSFVVAVICFLLSTSTSFSKLYLLQTVEGGPRMVGPDFFV